MPNDEPEQLRMSIQHRAQWLTLGRRNYLSPLSTAPGAVRRILDLGTGTGEWSFDMSEQFPTADIIGVDLSPIQPTYVPANVRFEIDDIEDEWTFGDASFDFIFSKVMLAGSISDFGKYFRQAYRATRPGGYFECHELTTRISSDYFNVPVESAMREWCRLMHQGIALMHRHLDLGFAAIASQISAAGFEDVTVIPFKQPIGGWPADPTLRESGRFQLAAMLEGFESLSLAVFMRMLRWEKEEVEGLLDRCRRELSRKRSCYYWPG
jgi:SAM-dependent methyltransferase